MNKNLKPPQFWEEYLFVRMLSSMRFTKVSSTIAELHNGLLEAILVKTILKCLKFAKISNLVLP